MFGLISCQDNTNSKEKGMPKLSVPQGHKTFSPSTSHNTDSNKFLKATNRHDYQSENQVFVFV